MLQSFQEVMMNKTLKSTTLPSGCHLHIIQGDITIEDVDAIVNAANHHLQHGGGVAYAISHKGGPTIQEESDAWIQEHGLVTHSKPAYTSGGNLPARYVIHTVGPMWGEGDEETKLRQAILGSLETAQQLKLSSIALPAISTGIFGFPKDLAAKVIFSTIHDYFLHNPQSCLKDVRLVLYDQLTVEAFEEAWEDVV
jgi:O-acetyl-ADP-ribose deacetylase (regulator of RNase III)